MDTFENALTANGGEECIHALLRRHFCTAEDTLNQALCEQKISLADTPFQSNICVELISTS